jgi:pyridoxal 5'-phosphate synthase pdxT subunit
MALQGAFNEHVKAFDAVGARTRLVRLKEDLDGLDGLVIPGGESTTMTMLMERMGLFDAVRDAVLGGLPTLGTCAGMIILAHRVSDGIDGQRSFDALDIDVRRNGYGRQLESFEAPLELAGDDLPFPGVFIRAPLVEDSGSTDVIARHDGQPVGVRKGRTMALSFHPELSGDLRLHREFLRLVKS